MWFRVSCAFFCLGAIQKLGAFLLGLGAKLGSEIDWVQNLGLFFWDWVQKLGSFFWNWVQKLGSEIGFKIGCIFLNPLGAFFEPTGCVFLNPRWVQKNAPKFGFKYF